MCSRYDPIKRFARRIGVTVKSVWVRREEKEEKEEEEEEDSAGEKGAIRSTRTNS